MRLLVTTQAVDSEHSILGFFHSWLLEFAKHFEEIDVICLYEGEHDLPPHVSVYSLGKESGENRLKYIWRFYRYFWKLYVRKKVDFVFFHMGAVYNIMAVPFFLIRKFKKTRFLWWKTHGHITIVGRVALFFVDRVYTAVRESFPIESAKRYVVGHAIDIDLFNHVTNHVTNHVILFVGRISRTKRVEQVLLVAKELEKRGREVKVRIIGRQINETYTKELMEKADRLGLKSSVTFVDGMTQAELVKEYQTAAVCMNPSDTDGLDKVVLEAMACGSIPVTANVSFRDMLMPFGLYMQKGDIKGYTICVEHIFGMQEDELNALRNELRNIVVTEHALSTLSKRIFGIG